MPPCNRNKNQVNIGLNEKFMPIKGTGFIDTRKQHNLYSKNDYERRQSSNLSDLIPFKS